MTRPLKLAIVAIACLCWAATVAAEPDVTVSLDASPAQVTLGQAVRLEVRVRTRGGSIESLNLDDLRKYPELEIVSHQTVRPMQFSFGFGSGVQVESSLAHVYVLRATAPGTYDFEPAVAKVDGKTYRSQSLSIVVTGNGGGALSRPSGSTPSDAALGPKLSGARYDARAFLRTVVEPDEVHVGEQVDVTVYLYTRLRLSPQSLMPGKPSMDGFWAYDTPITSLQAETVDVNGMRFRAYALYRSSAFPQRSGELVIGPPKVSFDVGTMSLFDAPERVELEGVPVDVRVLPLPQPGHANAVVGRYDLEASLDRPTVSTGNAVTLRVYASGVGNVQDLRIDLPPMVGVRALRPAIRDEQRVAQGKLAGTRSWEWILIAETPGEHTVPPIELHYFDPSTEQYGSSATPPLVFTASGASKQPEPTIEPRIEGPKRRNATFGPIRMYSALARGQSPVRDRGWFAWLLALPPIAFVFIVLGTVVARRREQRSTTAGAVQRKLLRSAQSALDDGEPRVFYDRIVASITHALDVRLKEPVGGLPHSELRTRLLDAGYDDDLVQRVINELEGADFARFAASGIDQEEMERCLDRTDAIVQRVQRTKESA